jgi:hypothetical protein
VTDTLRMLALVGRIGRFQSEVDPSSGETGALDTAFCVGAGVDQGVVSRSAARLSTEFEPTLPFTGCGLNTWADGAT